MPSPLADVQVNLFHDAYHPEPIHTLSLSEVLYWIREGRYRADIQHVRDVLHRSGEQAYRRVKNRLQAITFAGTFAPSRSIEHLLQHTSIIHGDLDHLDNITARKQAIAGDSRTVYAFCSPRGDGLKIGVYGPIVASDPEYKHAWQVISQTYENLYGGTWDPSGKDICRLCFVSVDPELYTNFDAKVFDVPPAPRPEPRPQPQHLPVRRPLTTYRDYAERAIQTAVQMIQSAPMGTRHHTRLRAARLLGGFVAGDMLTEDRAYGVLAAALVGYTGDLQAALKTVEDGLRYGQAHPITAEDLEAERQAWIDQHPSISHTSPKKPPIEDPWAGRRTLPLRPYGGIRMPREVRRG